MSSNQGKRFVPIRTYCELSGLSYATVDHLLKSGQVKFITTESGLRRVDTQEVDHAEPAIFKKLDDHERLLKALCGHLGVG